jgi:hypothetical protein
MSSPASRLRLSIVVTGRNDGYGGDFVKRFFATLEFNHRELAARQVPYEVVLVEWAPLRGRPLLADLVDQHCTPAAAEVVRAVIVDAAYHDAVMLNPRLAYQEFLAKNVGVRRARGEYLIVTNCDVIFGRHILGRLERGELQPRVVFRAARWDLVPSIDVDHLDWRCLEDPANLSRPGKKLRPPYFRGATGDFIALDRASFHELRGFNEVYRVARFGVDANFLVHAVSSGLTIADIGGPVYHVDHEGSYQTTRAKFAGREAEAPYGDERWHYDSVVYRNRANWGLDDAPQWTIRRRTHLDFSASAIPPFVDLSGIVLATPAVAARADRHGRG